MKRKIQKGVLALLTLALVASCSTTNDVASNRGIQKRKYTKGYFFDFNNKIGGNSHDNIAKNDGNPNVETIESTEEVKVRNYETEVVYVENQAEIVPIQESISPEVSTKLAESPQVTSYTEVDEREVKTVTIEELNANHAGSKFMRKEIKMNKRKVNSFESESLSDDAILYYILAILIPFLAVGLVTDWDLTKVLICLLLCFLFYLPGMIYALIVVSQNV